MELLFEIDWGQGFVQVPPPRNWKGFQVKVIFTEGKPNATVQGLDFEWVGENAQKLNAYKAAGLTGGRGIYEPPGLRVSACKSQTYRFFDGFIDLGNEATKFSCDMVVAPSKETGRIDWLNDIAAAISFDFLATLPVGAAGRIVPGTDFKMTPYCITEIPDYTRSAMLSVSLFVTLKELYDTVFKIGSLINQLTGDTATAVATLGAGAPSVIATIAIIILYVAYLVAIAIAIVTMVKDLVKYIFQTKKYKLCMREQDIFARIAQYFGMGFVSTSVYGQAKYANATYMPEKSVIPSLTNPLNFFQRHYDESVGFPNNPDHTGYPNENCRDWISKMCQKYRAGIAIQGNTLYFEKERYWNLQSSFTIPNTSEPGYTANLPDPYGTNLSELPSNYLFAFATEIGDLTTTHRYRGTSASCTISQINVGNIRRVSHQNGVSVLPNIALAKRKDYLSGPENLLNIVINGVFGFVNTITSLINGLINVVNAAISLFGGNTVTIPTIPPLPTNILNNRLGWMELSNDTFGIPKTFIGVQSGTDWLISPSSEADMSARSLFDDFHSEILATRGNQQHKYRENTFRFCCEDYIKILNKNVVTTPRGLPGKLKEFTWNPHDEMAVDVEYREYSPFTNNLQETIRYDGRKS